MEAGTMVRNNGQIGIVVHDFLNLCGNGSVLVEFDGKCSLISIKIADLEFLDVLKIETDGNKCRDCAFYNGTSCSRYSPGRMGKLLSLRIGAAMPIRIYPYCKSPE